MTSIDKATTSAPSSLLVKNTLEERLEEILNAPANQFSVASYLNIALEDQDGSYNSNSNDAQKQQDLSQRMAEVALSLQLQTTACHEDISKLGAELQAILPRCAADVGRLGVGLEGLAQDAATLYNMSLVDTAQEEVSSSLETLSVLHALQSNLQKTRSILHAAATWDTTLASVAPLLATQDWTQAVRAIVQLTQGEKALRGMPHPEQRSEAIQKLQQQVLALLQPHLAHALSNMHTRLAPLQQCVSLYTQLEQEEILQQEYVKYRPASVHKMWFEYNPKHSATVVSNDQPHAFLEWLPTWLDAVLSLLNEERRQIMTVFGPQKVPEIMLKVLRECFRPILPSFKSRLEALCSSTATSTSNAANWPTLAALYESTLRFLSITYETMVGGWMDLVEAGTLVIAPSQLLLPVQSLFVYIMTPFASYQKNAWQLEQNYLQVQCKPLTLQMQQVVEHKDEQDDSPDVAEQWQQIIQMWSDGAPKLFNELLPPSMDRLSLLNGGFHTTQILPMLDHCVTTQIQSLTLSVNKLTTNYSTLQDSIIMAALSFLQVAGLWKQCLQQWENRVRDRLQDWVQRRQMQEQTESVWKEALADVSPGGQSKGMQLIPDSWSPLDVNAYLLSKACHDKEGEVEDLFVTTLTTMQKLASIGPTTMLLFPEATDATRRFVKSCHKLVFNSCNAVPQQALQGMSSMASWKESDTNTSAGADFSYGTLPQTYITQVGEHMLALVRALEPFASDPQALVLANTVMDNIQQVALPPWQDFAAAAGFTNDTSLLKEIMDAKVVCEYTAVLPLEEVVEEEEEDEDSKAVTAFCNKWLDVVGLAVTGRLLERIMRIPSLTVKGCEHLSVDLNYLINVLSALGVSGHPHPLLSHFAELVTLEDDILHERIEARNRLDRIASALLSAEEKIVAIRSASNSFK